MSTELQGAIKVLVGRIDQKAQELTEMKRMVNSLCKEAEMPVLYADADLVVRGSAVPSLDSDQFYGKSPVTAAREYLELRGKAVPLEEILDALGRGGFDFETQGWKDESARLRIFGISLGKNSAIFHRLPSDTWGLTKWYPNAKTKKVKANGKNQTAEVADEQQSDSTAETTEQAKTANAE